MTERSFRLTYSDLERARREYNRRLDDDGNLQPREVKMTQHRRPGFASVALGGADPVVAEALRNGKAHDLLAIARGVRKVYRVERMTLPARMIAAFLGGQTRREHRVIIEAIVDELESIGYHPNRDECSCTWTDRPCVFDAHNEEE